MPQGACPAAPVRVLVVDDQPTFQTVARELIDSTAGFEWVGSASCGEEGVEQAERLRPDLVLMDIRMPGIGGFEAARQIAARRIPATVVLISADNVPDRAAGGNEAEIIPKENLSPSLLRHLWKGGRS